MQKICLFAPNLNGGGAERIVSVLANHLVNRGFKVDLVLVSATGPYLENISEAVNVIDLQCKRVLLSTFKLAKYLRVYKPRVVFASQMHAARALILAIKFSGINSKVIIRQPTMLLSPHEKYSIAGTVQLKLFLFLVRRYADKVIATSQTMADEFVALSKISRDKVKVIYNPLPITQIQERSQESLNHPWFQEGQPPVVLAVGRLEAVKNFSSLIRAFSLVVKSVDSRLVILGEGSKRASLELLISELGLQECVHMPGFVDNPYQYMSRAKVFVQSSIREGFSNGLIEAMACGMQVVATDCVGGTSEILSFGKFGQLVKVDDDLHMANALLKAVVNASSPKALPYIRAKNFDIDTILSMYTELL